MKSLFCMLLIVLAVTLSLASCWLDDGIDEYGYVSFTTTFCQ
ncbi:hypothetical protein JMUB7504_27580 [Staphylococcus aureus]